MSVKSECQEFQARLRRGEVNTPGGAKSLGGLNEVVNFIEVRSAVTAARRETRGRAGVGRLGVEKWSSSESVWSIWGYFLHTFGSISKLVLLVYACLIFDRLYAPNCWPCWAIFGAF